MTLNQKKKKGKKGNCRVTNFSPNPKEMDYKPNTINL